MNTYSLMVVDQDKLFCDALDALLRDSPFRVRTACPDIPVALARLDSPPHPDIILVDIADDDLRVDELNQLRDRSPESRIVLLGDHVPSGLPGAALALGAAALLSKSISFRGLVHALHLVMLGEAVFPVAVVQQIATKTREDGESTGTSVLPSDLSRREIQILRCLLAGQSNKSIGRHLQITESTVKMHFKNLMRKISAQNRTQAAIWAIEHGITPLGAAPPAPAAKSN